jgi:hypothetical protein
MGGAGGEEVTDEGAVMGGAMGGAGGGGGGTWGDFAGVETVDVPRGRS